MSHINMYYHNLDTVIKNLEIFDKYIIVETLKSGKNRYVYKIYDTILKIYKVLKIIISNNFTNEQKKIYDFFMRCNHKNFSRIFDIYEENIFTIIEIEYINGITMSEYFTKLHSSDEYNNILINTNSALKYIHSNNIIHGDIKPDNIIINNYNIPIIIDYCLCKYISTKYDNINGTKFFMAPELLTHRKITPKIDVWALGVSLYSAILCHYNIDMYEYQHSQQCINMNSIFDKYEQNISIFGHTFISCIDMMLKDEKERPIPNELEQLLQLNIKVLPIIHIDIDNSLIIKPLRQTKKIIYLS